MSDAHLVEFRILEGELARDPLVLLWGRHRDGTVVVLIQDLPNQQNKWVSCQYCSMRKRVTELNRLHRWIAHKPKGNSGGVYNAKNIPWNHEQCVCVCIKQRQQIHTYTEVIFVNACVLKAMNYWANHRLQIFFPSLNESCVSDMDRKRLQTRLRQPFHLIWDQDSIRTSLES